MTVKKRGLTVSLFYFWKPQFRLLLLIHLLIFAINMSAQTSAFQDAYFGWSFNVPAGWEINTQPFDEFDLPEDAGEAPFQEVNLARPEHEDVDGLPDNLSGLSCWSLPLFGDDAQELIEEEIEDALSFIQDEGQNFQVTKGKMTISGKEFVRVDLEDQDNEFGFLNNIYLLAPIKDYVLRIEIAYDNFEDRDVLLNLIETSQFKAAATGAGK